MRNSCKTKIGDVFGDLVITDEAGKNKYGHRLVECLCSCGTKKVIHLNSLKTGLTKSCGCKRSAKLSEANKKHGMYKTRVYAIWRTMLQRCRDPKSTAFTNYGGRGISVCDEWHSFENFIKDMGEPPTPSHSIDRIDSNGNYCKENCRWATSEEQQNNKRNNRRITIDGTTKTLTEWCRHFDVNYDKIRMRLNAGYSLVDAINAQPDLR